MTTKPRLVAEVGLVIYPDCQLSAVYGLTDIFRIAGSITAERDPKPSAVRVTHWAQDRDSGTMACSYDSHPGGTSKPNYLILPPSLIMPHAMQPMSQVAAWMKARHATGATLCSVCAGAFVLGETGLLDGRQATTHWAFADELARRLPTTRINTGRMIIDDGDIITAGGILAWTDLGLTLAERLLGPAVMLEMVFAIGDEFRPDRIAAQPLAEDIVQPLRLRQHAMRRVVHQDGDAELARTDQHDADRGEPPLPGGQRHRARDHRPGVQHAERAQQIRRVADALQLLRG